MPLHEKQFAQAAFQGYINNYVPAKVRILSKFLPNKPIYDTKFSYNVINGKYAQGASITGFNAGAPLRSKQGLEKAFGEVAKIQHGFRLDEEELLRYNQPRNTEEQQQVVDEIFDNTDDLIEGILDTEEWMRAQVLYKGRLEYAAKDVEIDVDFDIPAANKITSTTLFSDYANATPLQQLQAAVKQFKDTNRQQRPVEMHMSETMVNDLLQNEQIKSHIYGSATDSRIVTQAQLQALFTSLNLPTIVLQDEVVDIEGETVRLLPERRIVFLGAGEVGNTFQGITVEKNYKPGMYVIPEIKETNPPMQAVYVGETVFPALSKNTAIVHLDA
jgi:hypothetical protein